MTPEQLEILARIACFMFGVSVASFVYELIAASHLKSISKSLARFVAWAEKEDKK